MNLCVVFGIMSVKVNLENRGYEILAELRTLNSLFFDIKDASQGSNWQRCTL